MSHAIAGRSAASPAGCRVVLVGMMGSGKTTIGRLLAARTGWPYVDNDEVMRRLYGATSREILAAQGEAPLRSAEITALRTALSTPAPAIVAAAAGTILDDEARGQLAEAAIVVWLRASAEALEQRAGSAAHRPWVDLDADSWLEQETGARAPLYASVADVVVDTDAGSPADAASRILDELRISPACGELLRAGQARSEQRMEDAGHRREITSATHSRRRGRCSL